MVSRIQSPFKQVVESSTSLTFTKYPAQGVDAENKPISFAKRSQSASVLGRVTKTSSRRSYTKTQFLDLLHFAGTILATGNQSSAVRTTLSLVSRLRKRSRQRRFGRGNADIRLQNCFLSWKTQRLRRLLGGIFKI